MRDENEPLRLDDLRAYAIAMVDMSQGYFGRVADVTDGVATLIDACALVGGYQIHPHGGFGRAMQLLPIECLCDLTSIQVRFATLVRLSDLSASDFAHLGRGLLTLRGRVDGMRSDLRAQRAGIVLGGNGTLPRPPKPRLV